MADPLAFKRDTLSLHAGQKPDPTTGARAVPIYQTTSYVFDDTEQAASLFNLERAGHIYSRISNPTVAVLEERIAALEGGVGAVCTASGQAALHLAVVTLMDAGGHIVSSASIYGGSHNLFTHTLPRFGIETSFVDPRDTDGFRQAIRPETRLVFGETLGNPGLEIMDMPAVATIAHDAGVPLMIDSTFATPCLCRPFELGCDIVMHSATKFLGGHGVAIGGVIVDAGTFDWEASGLFPTLTEPYAGYHGIDFAEEFGPAAFHRTRTRGGPAGLRRVHEPHQCLLHPPGRGEPAGPHGASCRKRAQDRRLSRRPRWRLVGELPGASLPPPTTSARRSCCRRARARSSASA